MFENEILSTFKSERSVRSNCVRSIQKLYIDRQERDHVMHKSERYLSAYKFERVNDLFLHIVGYYIVFAREFMSLEYTKYTFANAIIIRIAVSIPLSLSLPSSLTFFDVHCLVFIDFSLMLIARHRAFPCRFSHFRLF